MAGRSSRPPAKSCGSSSARWLATSNALWHCNSWRRNATQGLPANAAWNGASASISATSWSRATTSSATASTSRPGSRDIAEPGGICVSEDALRQVRGKIDAEFADIGAGQHDLAIAHIETSPRLSPREHMGQPLSVLGEAYFFKRQFEEAVSTLLLAIQDHPGYAVSYRILAAC